MTDEYVKARKQRKANNRFFVHAGVYAVVVVLFGDHQHRDFAGK